MKLRQLLLCTIFALACALCAGATECTVATFAPEVLVFKGVEMVALRPLAEILGTEAHWNTGTNVVYLTRGGKNFSCRQGSITARANNQDFTLPMAPFDRVGVLYAPLHPAVEALGGTVKIDKAIQLATISFPDSARMLELQMTDYGNADPATFRDTAPQFYCIGLYGNNPRRLTYHTFDWVSGNLPTFSPDGKQMAYYEKDMLCLRAVDGTLEKYLCKVNYPDGDYLSPVFQLNGKSIVFKDTEEIDGRTAPVMKSYSLTDGTVRKLTAQDFVEQSSPAFNADKTKIVFAKDNPPAIFIANPDHTGEIQLTKARTIYERDSMPAFSPDGGSIVFKRSDDLFAMNTDTSQLRRLNPPGSHVIEFTFTPDGTQVIFSARPEKLVR